MSFRQDIKGLYFFIAGAAKSGISVAKLLKKHGANIFVTEEKTLSNETKKELNEFNIPYEQDGHSLNKIIAECDVMILSPGIPLSKEISLLCKINKIPIVSEIEIASWFMDSNDICLAITGTNGKSTTVNYLSQLVSLSKYKSKACGNIGISVSQTIMDHPDTNLFSIEFSSYQLETTYSLRPLCTALLNLQNDHLGRYENLAEYLKAKWRLILLTDDNGIAIIEKNTMKLALKLGLSLPRSRVIIVDDNDLSLEENNLNSLQTNHLIKKLEYGKTLPISIYQELNDLKFEHLVFANQFEYAYAKYDIKNGYIQISLALHKNKKTWKINKPCLSGKHNMTNILCASLMAMHIGISDKIILSQWEENTTQYQHLAHRLEKISLSWKIYLDNSSNEKKLLIINDSKATNIESTLVALESFQLPIRLLLGGDPKGDSYLPVTNYLSKNLIKIYPFGKAKNAISNDLIKHKNYLAKLSKDMLTAANLAIDEANENEIILLSPGCSSFDEFNNFEHRGDVFRKWAVSHLKENKK